MALQISNLMKQLPNKPELMMHGGGVAYGLKCRSSFVWMDMVCAFVDPPHQTFNVMGEVTALQHHLQPIMISCQFPAGLQGWRCGQQKRIFAEQCLCLLWGSQMCGNFSCAVFSWAAAHSAAVSGARTVLLSERYVCVSTICKAYLSYTCSTHLIEEGNLSRCQHPSNCKSHQCFMGSQDTTPCPPLPKAWCSQQLTLQNSTPSSVHS